MMLAGWQIFTPVYILFIIVIPVLVIFMQEPLERALNHEKLFPEGIGGFLMTNVLSFGNRFDILIKYDVLYACWRLRIESRRYDVSGFGFDGDYRWRRSNRMCFRKYLRHGS